MFIPLLILVPRYSNGQEIAETQKPHQIDVFSCVSFVRHTSFWGWDFPQVNDASEIPATSDKPVLGGIALYSYSNNPHASLVVAISTSTYDVIEANYRAGEISRRTLPLKGDKFLRGFFNGFNSLSYKAKP